jgi:hypothetical protein
VHLSIDSHNVVKHLHSHFFNNRQRNKINSEEKVKETKNKNTEKKEEKIKTTKRTKKKRTVQPISVVLILVKDIVFYQLCK